MPGLVVAQVGTSQGCTKCVLGLEWCHHESARLALTVLLEVSQFGSTWDAANHAAGNGRRMGRVNPHRCLASAALIGLLGLW